MAFEMIYTSQPRTLDGADYGVVACTDPMPAGLERLLRRLNRYDYELNSPGGPRSTGPVVHSHLQTEEGPAGYHILSRIARGGRDHSEREVFLAHHVALSGNEIRGIRPTDLIRQPGLFLSEWVGEPRLLPPRSISSPPIPDDGDRIWEAVAGHRQWARAWVDCWRSHDGSPCYLVAPGASDLLGLFSGACALLDPTEAGRITWITDLVEDRVGFRFDWIGLEVGSDLAAAVLGRFPDRTLDLTRPRPAPPASPQRAARRRSPRPVAPEPVAAGAAAYELASSPPVWGNPSGGFQVFDPTPAVVVVEPPPLPPEPSPRWRWTALGFGGVLVIELVSGSIFWAMRLRPTPQQAPASATVSVAEPNPGPGVPDPPRDGRVIADHRVEVPPPASQPAPPPPPPVVVPVRPVTVSTNPGPGTGAFTAPVVPLTSTSRSSPARRLARPIGIWPLRRLRSLREGESVRVVDHLDGLTAPRFTLLTPPNAALRVERPPSESGPGLDVWLSRESRDSQGIRLQWVTESRPGSLLDEIRKSAPAPGAALPAAPGSIEARLLTPSAGELIDELTLTVLRIRSEATSDGPAGPAHEVGFVPIVPELPLNGTWRNDDSETREGVRDLLDAARRSSLGGALPDRPRVVLDRLTLAFLPAEARGWAWTPDLSGEDDSPISQVSGQFELIVRGTPGVETWPFQLTIRIPFGGDASDPTRRKNPEPRIESRLTHAAGPAADPSPLRDNPTTRRGGSRKRSTKAEPTGGGDSLLAPVAADVGPGQLLSEMLSRFGRACGSIRLVVVSREPGQPDGPREPVEILRFDVPPQATRSQLLPE